MIARTILAWLGTIALSASAFGGLLPTVLTVSSGSGLPGSTVDLAVELENGAGDAQGWSYGICHDPLALTLIEASPGTTALTVNNGEPASFLEMGEHAEGYTTGVVICLTGCATLPIGAGYQLTVGTYSIDGEEGATTDVCPCSTLGSPPIATVLVLGGASVAVDTVCGTVEAIAAPPQVEFVRGDANNDGSVNIADGIWMLAELFLGGVSFDCREAKDANADGAFDTADPITVLNFRFLSGPSPSAPFPDCGAAGPEVDSQTQSSCLGGIATQ